MARPVKSRQSSLQQSAKSMGWDSQKIIEARQFGKIIMKNIRGGNRLNGSIQDLMALLKIDEIKLSEMIGIAHTTLQRLCEQNYEPKQQTVEKFKMFFFG